MTAEERPGTELAPEGQVWVCFACGKTSRTHFGFDEHNKNVADAGWDGSCMLNSELIPEADILERTADGRVRRVV